MTTATLDWSAALSPGARIIRVILVAGVPRVLTPSGVRPTTVSVPSGTVDALWWPGTGSLTETLPDGSTFDPVEDLLDPGETFEVWEKASLLDGTVDVGSVSFSVLDPDGRATAMLSGREALTSQLLAAEITPTSTTVSLASAGGFPASGIAAVGRETFLYSSITGNDLATSLVTRGRYGSTARTHGAPASHPPLVTAGGPRHWQGCLCTMWLCALSDDGTTLVTPSLVYVGVIGPGVGLRGNLTRWNVPVVHASKVLSRKVDTPPVDLYGYAHFSIAPDAHPLVVGAATYAGAEPDALSLQWSPTDTEDNGGWHPSRDAFVRAANAAFSAGTTGAGSIVVTGNGHLSVRMQGSNASPRWFSAAAAWDGAVLHDYRVDDDTTPAAWVSLTAAPEACFRLFGPVKIPSAEDFARIPATLSWTYTTTDGVEGSAAVALIASTDAHKDYVSIITSRDPSTRTVRCTPAGVAPVHTKRTPAKLGIVARGGSMVAALRAGARGIAVLTGADYCDDVVDWDHLERALAAAPSGGLPQQREYRFAPGLDTFLDVLRDELRLRGMCLIVRHGRLTGARLRSVADVEGVAASIVEGDVLMEGGREIAVEVTDSTEPLAVAVAFKVPAGEGAPATITVTDATFQSEFGDAPDAIECNALMSVPRSVAVDIGATIAPLYAIAQQILGPLAEPSRTVGFPLTGPQLGLQSGDLVAVTHSRIPTWRGVRGLTASVCQVQEVRRVLFAGRLRVTAVVRLQSAEACAYTPEVIVAAGGLTGGSAVATVDATTGWGPPCHAQDTTATGAASTNALDGFSVGDVVTLSQLGERSPIADEQRTVVAVGASTITLDSPPSAGMVTAAAGQYGVSVRWTDYDAATSAQHVGWGWIADATTGTLGAGSAEGKRWAA